jgi:acetyl-CoA acetyltransferase
VSEQAYFMQPALGVLLLRKLASIISVGMSKIGRFPELNGRELVVEAFLEAWASCKNLERKDIGAVFVGNQSETYEHQIMYGSLISDWLGLLPKGSMRLEGCAAAGALALRAGVTSIMSGLHDVVLVCGVEKMSLRNTNEITDALMAASDLALEQYNGMTFPSIYALMARAHMSKYGSTEEDFASVAVKNHANALDNPKAHLHKKISSDDVLRSRVVASPLKLYDCSPVSDGAAVAILSKPEIATRFTDSPTFVVGMGNSSDTIGLYERADISWPGAVAQSCKECYDLAGLEPNDISFAEVHDAFTINEILHCEAAGFARRGQGQELVRSGKTKIGGNIPVNPSGGLKARGHPVGATGLCQIYEICNQLNSRCGKRQVSGAKYALAVNEGGSNAIVTTHIISN